MPIWLEAILGLLAIALCAVACWREDALVAWEARVAQRFKRGDGLVKKYQLGALTVSDKGLQDTKEEIVIELIDRMQKYVAEGKAAYENGDYTEEQKLDTITNLCGRFCGLAEFLQITMGIDVRRADGLLYTQEMFNHFHYWKTNLKIEIAKEQETDGENELIEGGG